MSKRFFVHTLDTNAIIYYLKDDKSAVSILDKIFAAKHPIYISTITELELFGFPYLILDESERIENILQTLSIMPVDSRIARISGAIRRVYRVKTADSVVAATAMFTGTTLVTRNVQDFGKIPHLPLLKI